MKLVEKFKNSKFDKKLTYIYVVIFLIGVILIGLEYSFAGSGLVYDITTVANQQELIPDRVEQVDADTRDFYFTDVRVFGEADCLLFYSSHQNVTVYQGDTMLYQLERGHHIFDKTTGFHWNFVQLEQKASFIRIRVEALYPQVRNYNMEFYQGNAFRMFMAYVRESAVSILVSLLDVAIGMVLFAYWIILRKRLKAGNGLLYFGLFSALLGFWSFGETTISQMIITNRTAATDMGYILLMLIPLPFVLFVKDFLEIKEHKISRVICIWSLANALVCTTLHLSGVLAFKQTALATHVLLVAGLLYMLLALHIRKRDVGMDARAMVNMAGLFILAVTCVLDLTNFYVKAGGVDTVGRVGLLVYIAMVGYQAARETLTQLDQGYEAELRIELADKDNLTGLFNRNTYDRWVEAHPRPEGVTLLTFDLNYLKKCNDTLGHAMGDLYIKNAAQIIATVYGNQGTCYRIGGDEFCVVVNRLLGSVEMQEKFAQVEGLEKAYTPKEAGIPLQIAHGYAFFDKYHDANIEKCRERADKKMYENKQLRKEQG